MSYGQIHREDDFGHSYVSFFSNAEETNERKTDLF